MGGAIVIPLVGLLFPIVLLVGAAASGGAVISWTAYRLWHDRERRHHLNLHWHHR
jgi:hypothetical protein